jgi:hypothetical protein
MKYKSQRGSAKGSKHLQNTHQLVKSYIELLSWHLLRSNATMGDHITTPTRHMHCRTSEPPNTIFTCSTQILTLPQQYRTQQTRGPSRASPRVNEQPPHPLASLSPKCPQSPRHRLRHRRYDAPNSLRIPQCPSIRLGSLARAKPAREALQHRIHPSQLQRRDRSRRARCAVQASQLRLHLLAATNTRYDEVGKLCRALCCVGETRCTSVMLLGPWREKQIQVLTNGTN